MEYLEVAIRAAKAAGALQKKAFTSPVEVRAKGRYDVVSEIDYHSEEEIIRIIKRSYPDHSIVAEESGREDNGSAYEWYVDPLDGTSNFLIGIPYFSVSIALIHEGNVVLGVVYNPILKELYRAEFGKGAFLNDQEIHVSKQENLHDAIIASAYAPDAVKIKRGLHTIERLALLSRRVVVNFSPALDLCNIARGRLDAMVDNGTTPEDHAAGSLMVTEAGGVVGNYNKVSWHVNEAGVIASNGKLQTDVSCVAL